MEKKGRDMEKKVILDYLKKHYGKYETKDLKKKIIASGYSKKDFKEALISLGLNKALEEENKKEVKRMKIEERIKEMKKKIREFDFKSGVGKKGKKSKTQKDKGEKPGLNEVKKCSKTIFEIKKEIGRAIVGQDKIVDSLIRAILCDGHVLVEGVPGIAKTLAIKALAKASGCESNRIQFTVDLLPTDIVGLTTYTPKKGFETIKGPVFANFIIADEINRSPPKTQSSLIEAMQEKQVTIGRTTFKLPLPFFVMATENPLETSGVYTLPEAQIDRFLFKILMEYPKIEDENIIMEKNVTLRKFEDLKLEAVTSPVEIMKMQELTKKIYLNEKIKKYILRIINMTRTKDFENGKYVDWGASPRATIALFIASKARALMQGRNFVIPGDVKECVHEVLRHRIILTYRAGVEGITSNKIIDEILEKTRVP